MSRDRPNNPHPHHPPKQTPLMLINDVSRMVNNVIRKDHDKYNLQASYRHILFHLSHEDGCTQLHLVNKTKLKPPTVSVTLQKMEAEGYVRRVNDETDMRQTLVFLTDKGRDLHEEMHKKIIEIDNKILTNITEEEQEILCDILKRMIDTIIDEAGGVHNHGFGHEEDEERE